MDPELWYVIWSYLNASGPLSILVGMKCGMYRRSYVTYKHIYFNLHLSGHELENMYRFGVKLPSHFRCALHPVGNEQVLDI